MTEPSDDLVSRQLLRLTPVEPDAARGERVRARCHAALARQRRRRRLAAVGVRVTVGRMVELAAVAGVIVLYVSLVIRSALAAYGGS